MKIIGKTFGSSCKKYLGGEGGGRSDFINQPVCETVNCNIFEGSCFSTSIQVQQMFPTVFLLEKPPITFILTNHDEFLNKIEAKIQPIELYTYA